MMQKSKHGLPVLAILVALALAGCGGGGGGGSTTNTVTAGENSVVYAVLDAAPAGSCPNGGITVDAGIDTNGNGQLDDNEIIPAKRQYVCNGLNGSAARVSVADEPAGLNCATGGKKVSVGLDVNGNGVLDVSEIASSSYICNGAAGPAGSGVTWVNVTGTTQQAVSNTGYMANNAVQVTITLPAAPAMGDIVQVSGIGTGGWKIAQNAGQSVITRDIGSWTAHGPAGTNWSSVAASADGTKLVATTDGVGRIFSSADSGQNWTLLTNSPAADWRSIASSADGAKLVAVVSNGHIFTSTNSGANWTERAIDANRLWTSVASSSDGTNLVAGTFPGNIFTSTDSGVTWFPRDVSRNWQSVASSADGVKLVAVVSGGQIFTSTDSGLNWNSTNNSPSTNWQTVASSSDGTKLVAAQQQGSVYTSTDSGATWTPHSVFGSWQAVASSADGAKLAVVGPGGIGTGFGNIYLSFDSGQNWKQQEQWLPWQSVASSADGNVLVALEGTGGLIYSFRGATTVGTAGSVTGSQYDAIELQFIGNNTFTVLSHSGSLVVQ
jgi:photosystem II stability/assembly factor-like uncharacterized protein